MLTLQGGGALGPKLAPLLVGLFTEAINDVAIDALRARLHLQEGERVVIAHRESAHGPWLHAFVSVLERFRRERRFISGHELGRPGQPWERNALEATAAKVPTRLAVTIHEGLHKTRRPPHHRLSHSETSLSFAIEGFSS